MTVHPRKTFAHDANAAPASRPYSGRLIFDHLPKTAGQAISAWLRGALGDGCVTDNLIAHHRELINCYGGAFSVISAHVHFMPKEGLDPRYQYATIFRNPIDRVISWLFFVTKNHAEEQLPGLFQQCTRFLESEGKIVGDELASAISNHYSHHFSRILGTGEEDEETRLANALAALERYDVVGLYERLPDFINDLSSLIEIPAPERLEQVNVTQSRPAVNQISAKLRNRIIELNQLDLKLYAAVRDLLEKREPRPAPAQPAWVPLPPHEPRIHTTNDITIHSIEMLTPASVQAGSVMTFALDIELHLAISCLEAGIHIFDDQQRWAFGVNSTMLKQNYIDMKPGRHRFVHHIVARLPAGRFTAGFAFADIATDPARELFWHDAWCSFNVTTGDASPGIGYAICPARISRWHKPGPEHATSLNDHATRPGAGS